MKYFGHIKCHNGFEKRIMEGYIPGRRKRKNQKEDMGVKSLSAHVC
jgi:hypothetical protein